MIEPHPTCPLRAANDERSALPIEQRALLWCMRMRVIGMRRRINVQTCIDEMLEALGAPGASPCLEIFMVALSRGCTRMIEVGCVCQPRIGADERALLDVLALAQAVRPFDALLLLRGFVTQAGAVAALRAAEDLGTALVQAGRFLPEPGQASRHLAMTQAEPAAPAGHVTLH